jgi:HSP20 family protein
MPKVRNILPKKEHETGRALRPFTHSMEEFFESAFPRRWMEGFMEPYAWRRPFFTDFDEKLDVFPKVDILDKDDKLVVRADVPGIKKEDLEVTISGDRLIIEAKREYEEEEKKEEFVRHEMAYGRLYRSVLLPFEVLGDKANAEMKDGVLEIVLPKVEATTPYKVKVA